MIVRAQGKPPVAVSLSWVTDPPQADVQTVARLLARLSRRTWLL
jgi:hypothetical protein